MLWPRLAGALEHDAVSVNGNVLDHHHRIGAGRDSRAGHDLHALARADDAIEAAARLDFANAAQRGAGNDVIGAQAKPSRMERSNGG